MAGSSSGVNCCRQSGAALGLALVLFLSVTGVNADVNWAENIKKELLGHSARREPVLAVVGADGQAVVPVATLAGDAGAVAAYDIANAHPLQVSEEVFRTMYEDNLALWGDCTESEARLNYMRSMSGQADSARLLLEFSVVPGLKSSGTDLIRAALGGDVSLLGGSGSIPESSMDSAGHETLSRSTGRDSFAVVAQELLQRPDENGMSALLAAAAVGHTAAVSALLAEGVDPNARGSNGMAAIHVASALGHTDVLRVLFDWNADVDLPHPYARSTALHFAAEMGQSPAITLLCAAGADPESEKSNGARPLHIAADSNNPHAVKALLDDCDADPESLLLGDTTPLYLAAQKGFVDVVQVLVDEGNANQNVAMSPPSPSSSATRPPSGAGNTRDAVVVAESFATDDEVTEAFKSLHQQGSDASQPGFEIANGATALHAAVENGHIDVVRFLLSRGVKQQPSMLGATPLYVAAQYNRPKITKALLAAKGDPNVPLLRDGNTPLHVAVTSGFTKVVIALLQGGADPNKLNDLGASPVYLACGLGKKKILGQLLTKGGDPSIANIEGESCIHVATEQGHLDIVQKLLKLARLSGNKSGGEEGGGSVPSAKEGIDRSKAEAGLANLQGRDNRTPLHIACDSGRAAILAELLAAGGGANARVLSSGSTPVMFASKAGFTDGVRMLLSAGADPNIRAHAGLYKCTALHLAVQNGHLPIVMMLVMHGNANVNARMTTGATPLFIAAEQGNAALVKFLLQHQARVALTASQRTPLEVACRGGHIDVAKMLFKHGAKPMLSPPNSGSLNGWNPCRRMEDWASGLEAL